MPIITGMLKAWSAKTPAARTATSGTFSSLISFLTQRSESAMKTSAISQ